MSLWTKHTSIECEGHDGDVLQLAYSKMCPACQSGYDLASADRDGQTIVRDGATGELKVMFESIDKPILSIDISDNAMQVATGCADNCVRIWNCKDCELQTKFETSSPVNCVSIGQKSRYLALGCRASLDAELQTFSMERPEVHIIFPRMNWGVQQVLFCHDDRALLTSSEDGTIRLIDLLSKIQTRSIELPSPAKSLEMAADGRTVTVAYGQSVAFFDVDQFNVVNTYRLPARVMGASLHPEKRTFVCAGNDRCVYMCNYNNGKLIESFSAHDRRIFSIKYSPDGEVYATASAGGSVRLWQQTACIIRRSRSTL